MTRVAGMLAVALAAQTLSGQTLDRSKRPVAPPPPAFTFPAVVSRTLPNGLVVRIVENHALPLVAVRVIVEGGPLLDPAGKEGLFALDTLLVRDGTTSMTGAQLADLADELGSAFDDFDPSRRFSPARFTTIVGQFERSLALMGDMLMHPTFPAEAVERRKSAMAGTLQRAEGTAATPALRIFNVALWGASHPYARVATPASVGTITRDDVARFHDSYVRPQNVTLTIVGDVTPDVVMPAVTRIFGQWQRSGDRVRAPIPPAPAPRPTTIYLFDRPGSQQSIVFLGQALPSRDTPDFYALETMGALFGGPTGSRLTMSLRERRPLTYSISHIPVWRRSGDPASIHGSSSVDAVRTDSAIVVWLDELRGIAGARPPVDNELSFARQATVGTLLTRIETIDEVATRLNLAARDDLPPTFYNDYVAGMTRVTVVDVAAAATKVIDPLHTTIVVVGDRKLVEAALRAASIAPIVIVDAFGRALP